MSFYETAFTLAMTNSGINPLIYAWKNKEIRKAFIRLLQCQTVNFNETQDFFNQREDTKTQPVPVDDFNSIQQNNCFKMQEKYPNENKCIV